MKIQDKSRSKGLLSCVRMNCQGPSKKCMCQVDSSPSYGQTNFSVFRESLSFSSAIVGFLCVMYLEFGLICLWWCVGLVVYLFFYVYDMVVKKLLKWLYYVLALFGIF